jgi:hypothetical protein
VPYKVTPRTREAVRLLNDLATELKPHLGQASRAAQIEWDRLSATWPSEEHLGQGAVHLSEDDLDATVARVRRFRQIFLDSR